MTFNEKLLCELIAVPSVNPAFASDDKSAGEAAAADFLAATAARAGLPVELREVVPGRANFFTRFLPAGKIRQRILLAPHLDTVPLADPNQLSLVKKQGRIYGRGACDTKGSVAAMLSALIAVANSPQRPQHTEIIFAGLIDEEGGQLGSRAIASSKFKADLAIVGEPTELKIVTAHKGNLWLRFKTKGKAAHGATPELGKNAVHEMARVVDLLETQYARHLRKRRHPLLGSPTISVGTIRGGTQANVVPAACEMTADRRTLPGESEKMIHREIHQLLRAKNLAVTIENSKEAVCSPLETDYRLPLIQNFFQTTGQKTPVGVDYFCDASVLSNGGIPSVVFGPGNIAQAHTVDEWISIRSLDQATQLLTRFLQKLP